MRTQEAFQIPLLDFASRYGLRFNRTWKNGDGLIEHVYHSPLRTDRNASIYINETKNVWYDNGGIIDGGGITHLVNYLYGNDLNDIRAALQLLDTLYPELKHPSKKEIISPSNTAPSIQTDAPSANLFSRKNKKYTENTNTNPVFTVTEVKPLFAYPLKNYLSEDRKLNLTICRHYVKEVHYRHNEKNIDFYGIGFPSGDTWVVRRQGFKGFIGKGVDISVIEKNTDAVMLFEGFIDFLSYLSAKKMIEPDHTCIVLNSAAQTNKLITYLAQHTHIKRLDYFRDRDQAGLSTMNRLIEAFPDLTINDASSHYPNHNDLNEWWQNRVNKQNTLNIPRA